MDPLVIIQALTTQWTKRSRGSEKAALRNKTPESLPLPSWLLEKDTRCLRHIVEFAESAKFEARELVELDFKPVGVDVVCLKQPEPTWENSQIGCVHVLHQEDQLQVSFIGSAAGAPRRDNQLAFRLTHGQWGRIISNGRFSSWDDGHWWYEKRVVNVGLLSEVFSDVFLVTQPACTFTSLARLR